MKKQKGEAEKNSNLKTSVNQMVVDFGLVSFRKVVAKCNPLICGNPGYH